MEDIMKLIAPFCSKKNKTLGQEYKDIQEKVDEFEDQEKSMNHNSERYKMHTPIPK